MKNRVLIPAFLLLYSLSVAGGNGFTVPKLNGGTPWTHLKTAGDDLIRFAVITDKWGGNRPGVFLPALAAVNRLMPDFVMTVGDEISGYSTDTVRIEEMRDELDGQVATLNMPYFHTAGNHDISSPVMEHGWKKRYGATYYHFLYKNALFLVVCTDDEGKQNSISPEQCGYFKNVLDKNNKVRWTFVFFHKPLWAYDPDGQETAAGWDEFEALLKGRRYSVFAGHWHEYDKETRNGMHYYRLATTGGVSSLKGPADGTFDHIAWVTLGRGEPRVSNVLLDGLYGDDVRGEAVWRAVKQRAAKGEMVRLPVLLPDGETFTSATAPVRLANPESAAVGLTLRFRPDSLITITPDSIVCSLAAAADESVMVTFTAVKPVPVADMQPLYADWSLGYQSDAGDTYTFSGTEGMVITRPFFCHAKTEPVVLDGKLDEWPELPCAGPGPDDRPENISGGNYLRAPDDAGFSFGLGYRNDTLFIAVRTVDDTLFRDTTRKAWDQDCIQVLLNAKSDPARSFDRKPSNFWFTVQRDSVDGKTAVFSGYYPRAVAAAGMVSGNVLTFEMAVPFAWIDQIQTRPWQAVRINLIQFDYDNTDIKKGTQLFWQPNWQYGTFIPASGTFFRK